MLMDRIFLEVVVEEDPLGMPAPLGRPVTINTLVDTNHAGNMIRRMPHSVILMFVNNELVKTFNKRQNTLEASTFGSEMVAIRFAWDFIVEIQLKLKMFGVPMTGSANFYWNNK
jgi:hypothetical protein